MFHDTVMSLVVVLGDHRASPAIWYFTAGENPRTSRHGLLGSRYTDEADPGRSSFIPRPDWYFYFLFYLLRIFKWPESVVLGTVGIPTILLMLLIAMPFIDRRRGAAAAAPAGRDGRRDPHVLSMGVLTWKGATAKESLGTEDRGAAAWLAGEASFAGREARGRRRALRRVGLPAAATPISATGAANLGAPDLTRRWARRAAASTSSSYMRTPAQSGNT